MTSRIAHLSDLHFGAHDDQLVAGVADWLIENRPDLVIVSGDFTQRARVTQFRAAAAFLDRLRCADLRLLVVPGNHDVPLYDVVRRFAAPLRRYQYFISDNLCPWYEDDAVAVLGINTARSLTIKDGRINQDQIAMIRERFGAVARDKSRILVTHHPLFALPIGRGDELSEAVGRHEDAVEAVCDAGVHIALAGHFHRTYAEAAYRMTEKLGRALIIQAGTATSTRLRNAEPQSFNWLHIARGDHIAVQVVAWNGTGFARASETSFAWDGARWNVASPGAQAPVPVP